MATTRAKATARTSTPAPTTPAPAVAAAAIPQPQIPPPVQAPPGRAVAIGRDGKPIWRNAPVGGADQFNVAHLEPDGWKYEWKRYSVNGLVDHAYQAQLKRVGRWEPVLAENHDGVFLPPGSTGAIIIDGLILMERPRPLHDEAQRELKQAADEPMQKARRERGLQVPIANGVTGVSNDNAAARAASYVNVTRVHANADDMAALQEIPRPAYDYERNTID